MANISDIIRKSRQKRRKWSDFVSGGEKENKYRNKKCEYMGISFDSIKERDRYIYLQDCERKGLIRNLQRQVKFVLYPDEYKEEIVHLKTKDKTQRRRSYIGISYTADFVYEKENGERVVEDVKASPSLLPKEFQLKSKMLHYIHGIDLRLVYKATEPV